MLTAAESGRIFGGILNILTKPKARIEAREAFGAVYGVIETGLPIRTADWRRVASLAGRYADRMLIPSGIDPPPVVTRALFPKYERRVLLQTAVEIIKRTRMPMYRRIVGLADESGRYADFLYPLLQHYTSVKVVTKQTALYEAQAELMMRELGAPVMICDDYPSFNDCVLIVAPDGVKMGGLHADKPSAGESPAGTGIKCPILSLKSSPENQPGDFITDLWVVVPTEILSLCPHDIEPRLFSAALYEYCGVEPASFVAGRMMFCNREEELSSVVLAVMRAAGTLSVF